MEVFPEQNLHLAIEVLGEDWVAERGVRRVVYRRLDLLGLQTNPHQVSWSEVG